MSYPGAIVIAAGLIAGALILTGTGQTQVTSIGKYAIAAEASGAAAWRLDTTTGVLQRCMWETSGAPGGQVLCSRAALEAR